MLQEKTRNSSQTHATKAYRLDRQLPRAHRWSRTVQASASSNCCVSWGYEIYSESYSTGAWPVDSKVRFDFRFVQSCGSTCRSTSDRWVMLRSSRVFPSNLVVVPCHGTSKSRSVIFFSPRICTNCEDHLGRKVVRLWPDLPYRLRRPCNTVLC